MFPPLLRFFKRCPQPLARCHRATARSFARNVGTHASCQEPRAGMVLLEESLESSSLDILPDTFFPWWFQRFDGTVRAPRCLPGRWDQMGVHIKPPF